MLHTVPYVDCCWYTLVGVYLKFWLNIVGLLDACNVNRFFILIPFYQFDVLYKLPISLR